jgi:hypothetical protein
MIDPNPVLTLAGKMRADTATLDSIRVAMVAKPAEVAAVILAATASGAGQ